jgi:hypothetical protein
MKTVIKLKKEPKNGKKSKKMEKNGHFLEKKGKMKLF